MNQLDPAWLQTFVAIADCGALARAAQRVHRAPSTLSVQLRQLESVVGAQLIQRSTRRLQLTPEGERLLDYARRLLALQAEALQALQPRALPARAWRIGISEYFQPARLKDLLALLEDAGEGRPLEVRWGRSAELLRAWRAGRLDLAVIAADGVPTDGALLRREPLAWVAAPGWQPPAGQHLPLVLLADACPVRDAALQSLVRRGVPHGVRLACSGSQAAVAALRAGWGVGCLNLSAVPADLVLLAEQAPQRWPSPGRLAFHALAQAELAPVVKRLKRWLR